MKFINTILAMAALSVACAAPGKAQTPEQFFTGKTISFIVGAGAGGSYDLYARALANHMPRHIPGKPAMIVKLAGGVGGGISTAISVEHTAPKDGTTIGMTQQTNVSSQLTEESVKGKFDISKWRWIGNMAPLRNFVGVWLTAPAQSLEEAKTKEVIIGATGRTSPTFIVPQALNELIGTKFKFVLGYNGVADLNLAMERGEIQGRGASWVSVVTQAPEYITQKKLKPLVVDGLTRDPLIPDVPTLLEVATTPEQKAALMIICGSSEFARSIFLPPGVPQDRVDALRAAFDATMTDPAFLAEAQKLQLPIEPQGGAALDKIAALIVATPAPAVALAKKLLGE
jgi:tripartite-type tricarboxylate transporter receptor subunit TctC